MNKKIFAIIVTAILLVMFVFCCLCIDVVPTGHTGILIHYGQVSQEPLKSGKVVFHNFFSDKVAFITNKQQDLKVTGKIWGETNDSTPVYAEGITITYQIPPEQSVWLYTNVANIDKNLITASMVASSVKSALVELSPKDSTNRAKVEPLVKQKLEETIANKYGPGVVVIKDVTIDQMDFEDAYNQAIQAKSIATQQAQQAQIQNTVAIEKAEADKRIAEIQTEQQIAAERKRKEADLALAALEADAEADRILKIAQAEAEAKRMLSDSITPELIEYEKVNKWDGKLPSVMSTEDNLLLDVSTLK